MLDDNYRKALLDVLQEFHRFCEAHDLRYYLIGGGLIGAIRHQGFIPWDDDIDVAMPDADYQRFLALRDQVPEKFGVRIPNVDDGYHNTMTRMFSREHKIQEDFYKPFTIGPWIDVFPLNYTFDNKTLRFLHFRSVYLLKVLVACRLGGVNVKGNFKARLKLLVHYILLPIPKKFLFKIFDGLVRLKKKPSRYVANLMGRWREKEIILTEELDSRGTYPFSGIDVYSFSNYHAWLHRVYGDYMTLPKSEERVPDHTVNTVD